MEILFYTTSYLQHQVWADNFERTSKRDKPDLQETKGIIKDSYYANNGDLIHLVEYSKGIILVEDKSKIN